MTFEQDLERELKAVRLEIAQLRNREQTLLSALVELRAAKNKMDNPHLECRSGHLVVEKSRTSPSRDDLRHVIVAKESPQIAAIKPGELTTDLTVAFVDGTDADERVILSNAATTEDAWAFLSTSTN